jgi:hypothetical protein
VRAHRSSPKISGKIISTSLTSFSFLEICLCSRVNSPKENSGFHSPRPRSSSGRVLGPSHAQHTLYWNQIRCLTAACRALVDLQTNGDLLSSPSVVYGAAQQSNSGPLLFFVSYFFHLGTQRNGGKSSGKGCLFWRQIQRDSDKRNQRTGQKAPNTERQRRRKPTNRQGKKL